MKGLLALYLFSLAIAITSLSLSLSSLVGTNWIITRPFSSGESSKSPIELRATTRYGLFETCTSTHYDSNSSTTTKSGLKTKTKCRKFPVRGVDCGNRDSDKDRKPGQALTLLEHDSTRDESFCDRWLLAGYAHQLSLIFSITSILSLSLTLIGTCRAGRGYRTERLRSGWKLVVGLMTLQSVSLAIAWIVVVWEFHHESLFNWPRWGHKHLGQAFGESVGAFGLLLVTILLILVVRVTQKLRIVPEGAARDDGYDTIRD
ncbi:hypothetical protein JCM3766R1_005386 [Sporobolomyces carnicolor]